MSQSKPSWYDEAIRKLLSNCDKKWFQDNVQINAKCEWGLELLLQSVAACRGDILDILLSKSRIPAEILGKILHETLCPNIIGTVFKYNSRVNVNTQDEYGDTPLINAAIRGRYDAALKLLNYGADINMQSTCGDTALIKTARHKNTKVAKLLLSRGADTTIRNSIGRTAYRQAEYKSFSGFGAYYIITFEEFMQTPRSLKFCILKQKPKASIQVLLQWNDFDKEIKTINF